MDGLIPKLIEGVHWCSMFDPSLETVSRLLRIQRRFPALPRRFSGRAMAVPLPCPEALKRMEAPESSSKRINSDRLRFTSVALPWHRSLDLFGSINCTNNSSDRHFFLSSIWAAFFFRTLMPLQQLGIWKTTEFVYNLRTIYRKI